MECMNCGHDEGHHKWSDEHSSTICDGDGFFDATGDEPPDPQCDCDLFEEEEEE